MGEAWYRKSVDIPAECKANASGSISAACARRAGSGVNGKTVAWVDNYCGTYKYDVTDLVQPRTQAVVVAAVNNAIPSRKGRWSARTVSADSIRDVETRSHARHAD
jgi:hypothetical protein